MIRRFLLAVDAGVISVLRPVALSAAKAATVLYLVLRITVLLGVLLLIVAGIVDTLFSL